MISFFTPLTRSEASNKIMSTFIAGTGLTLLGFLCSFLLEATQANSRGRKFSHLHPPTAIMDASVAISFLTLVSLMCIEARVTDQNAQPNLQITPTVRASAA